MCDKCTPEFEMFRPVISLNRVKKPMWLKIRDWLKKVKKNIKYHLAVRNILIKGALK